MPPLESAQQEEGEILSCLAGSSGQPDSLPPDIDLSPLTNPAALPRHFVDAVRRLKSFLPIGCELLGQGDLEVIGSYPIDVGGFAEIWVGKRNDGTRVAIKSHRYYSSSSCLSIYSRLYKEALTCSRLSNEEKSFVPFIGLYSTLEHPFALVFQFMDHLNLKGYLRDNKDVGRLEPLLAIARGLRYMHSLSIVHGNIKTSDVLVGGDGRAYIAGLGAASTPSTVLAVDVDRSFHGAAPELIAPQRFRLANTRPTTASDVYAFAILAWEVFAGQVPFPDKGKVAGVYSMVEGRRPGRPDHAELSDRVWKMIKGCWKDNPAQRKTMADVVTVLEAEVSARAHKPQ